MLVVNGVYKSYSRGGMFSSDRQQILRDVSFAYKQGECLGIIGESGSGKSTLGRLLLGIEKPERGTITLHGESVENRSSRRGRISAVFQDYTSSINPYFTVEQAILEPLIRKRNGREVNRSKIERLLCQVGLSASFCAKYPHELSGGQIQRVCIARAIATESSCILLDEAISSLDGSVQMQVLQLLKDLKDTFQLGYLFITHDIQAAAYLCDRVLFLRSGQIEEIVDIAQLRNVQSPYAQKLIRMMMN
ncbi:ABC transporter ATP-binding protein [Cohnella panacarvi]|uniref:ABC transporter ATP-binding protein n=1 Tax=Cohnella panacarvi TaxID=400776 RepID=UPI0005541D39|nr:ABC transporter ATP-binding protein [Cohnella panacarvi]